MYKLLIADDEEIEINAFKVMVGSHFNDISIITAENGIDAIELARQEKPDLVFMDIEMPGLDGISAISEIKRENPRTRFVIHTAYSNFEYAQKAIKIGADDYLLKPVMMSTLIETIKRNINKIEETNDALCAFQKLEEKLSQLKPYIERDIIFSVINGVEGNSILQQYSSVFEIKIKKAYCIIFKVESLRNDQVMLDEKFELTSTISEEIVILLKQVCQCIAAEYVIGSVLAIVPFESSVREYEIRMWSMDLANYIRNKLRQKADIRVGIGGFSPNFESIHKSYLEAFRAMSIDNMSIIHFEDMKGDYQNDLTNLNAEENRLGNAIIIANEEDAINHAKKIFDLIIIGSNNNLTIVKARLLETFAILKRYIENNTINSIMISAYSDIELFAVINDQKALEKRFYAYIKDMMNEVSLTKEKRNSVIIGDVIRYIDQNYSNDISLEGAAEKICVTPYYLSRLFKKEMGINFNNYLTEIRLNNAKELLRNSTKSIKEIAYETGFNSQAYFCRVFKKKENKTPSEYIQSMTKSQS